MIKRTVEISQPSYLSVKNRQLVIEQEGRQAGTVPIEDLGVLIIDNRAVTCTQGVLIACWQENVVVVLCDERHVPGALLLPISGHSLHQKILRQQITASASCKKRLWQRIVRAKIEGQAAVLRSIGEEYRGLLAMARRVRSGDAGNLEAQAARAYWLRLFGSGFRRDRSSEGINTLLNYGYSVVRAATARAIVGAGLHPGLSIFHRNQYNSMALADDLVEPLRPLVDLRVRELSDEGVLELNRESKTRLLESLSWPVRMGDSRCPLLVALHQYAATVRACLAGERTQPIIPAL
nr:type II CRISPR-associated endonuclease Cas1 [Gammaproteobacteria bacterium]